MTILSGLSARATGLRRAAAGLLSVLPVLLTLLAPASALARAGGGEGFSGGGDFGGGGSDDGGLPIGLLIYLVFEHPVIGVPVLILVIVFAIKSGRFGRSAYVGQTIRRGVQAQAGNALAEGVARIRQRDPGFDETAFLQRCREAFPVIQQAWSNQDMTPARRFVSDGVFERFQLQLAMQQQLLIRNVMEQVVVETARVAGVHADAHFDTLHVAITATAVDTTADLRSGRRVAGAPEPARFTEVWSFLRRPGARTLARPGLLEGFCPNCGAPLAVADAVQCPSCQAVINSGEYDWVLAEISQAEAWQPHGSWLVPGLDELRRRDPAFNTQHIEDRASVIFWRLRAAECFAADRYLRKVSLPAFLKEHAAVFQPQPDGQHGFHADAAVGSVELTAVEAAANADGLDRLFVHIRWSGRRETAALPALMPPAREQCRPFSQDFVLVRRAGVTSVAAHALSSAHCPGCGAPETPTTDGACAYCGAVQNDGSTGWVLSAIQPHRQSALPARPPAPSGLPPTDSPLPPGELTPFAQADAERLLQASAAVMLADGTIDAREQAALTRMAARRGVTAERLQQLVGQVQAEGAVTALATGATPQNAAFLQTLIVMCLADGDVAANERRVIKALVEHMRYTDADIEQMIQRERARLYQQARRALTGKA